MEAARQGHGSGQKPLVAPVELTVWKAIDWCAEQDGRTIVAEK